MTWFTRIPGVSGMINKGFNKAKQFLQRKGSKEIKEKKPTQKEETKQPSKTATKEENATTKTEVDKKLDKMRGELKEKGSEIKPQTIESDSIAPSPTPNSGTGSNGAARGRTPWDDSHYQSPGNSHDQGMEV